MRGICGVQAQSGKESDTEACGGNVVGGKKKDCVARALVVERVVPMGLQCKFGQQRHDCQWLTGGEEARHSCIGPNH